MNETPAATPQSQESLHLNLPKRKSHWKRWTLLLIILVAGAAMALKKNGGPENEQAVQYKTVQAERGTLTVTVDATGNLEPTNEVEVGSEQSGRLETVTVDINDRVTKGQVLATIDTTKLDAEIEQAEATLAASKAEVMSAQATVKETKSTLKRYKDLAKISSSKAISQNDIDTAQAEYDRAVAAVKQAEASVKQAEATLESNKTDRAKTIITSPIDGVVLTRSVDPGQTVAASLETPELFTIAEDLAKMYLDVDVDEAEIGKVSEGQSATFTVDAYPTKRFPAHVLRVSYGATNTDDVITYETRLDVDNSSLTLRPGMTATATIVVQEVTDGLLVPNGALRFTPPDPSEKEESNGSIISKIMPHPPQRAEKKKTETITAGKQNVWVVKDGQLESIEVTTGATDGKMTEITEGAIEPGMELVTDTMQGQ